MLNLITLPFVDVSHDHVIPNMNASQWRIGSLGDK